MLTFETPIYRIDEITVYRDHVEPALFYFAAPQPQVTRQNGRVMFDLLTYSVELSHSHLGGTRIPDELGAGFLTLGVDCALPETKRRRIISEIASATGVPEEEIILHPIPYHQGRVKLLALDQFTQPEEGETAVRLPEPLRDRPTFVERVLGSGTPSLLGDLQSIFSLTLSQQGVTFLEGLYRQGAAPVGILYELDFHGLRPAIDVRIHADLSRIYEHFGGGLGVSYQWIKAEVGAEIDKLEETSAIEVEITSQATGDEAQKSKELALSLFKDRIVQELFRPTAPSRSLPQAGNALGELVGALSGTGSVALTLKVKESEELKKATYDFRERAPEERTHAPQGFLPVLLSPTEMERRIHRVNLQNEFFEVLEILVTGPPKEDFARFGIRQAQVRLIYPFDEEQGVERTLLFRPESTGDKTVAFRRAGRQTLTYAYQITYEFEQRTGTDADALRYEMPIRTTTARVLPVNPHADFGLLDVQIEAGRVHSDVKEVDVLLAYTSADLGFSADERFRFTMGENNHAPKRWQVRTRNRAEGHYSATYTFTFHNGGSYTAPSIVTTDRLLSVNTPFRHERRLLIRPNAVSEQTTAITVELEYRDEARAYQRSFLLDITPPFASREISWPILDPDRLRVRYRVTVAEAGFLTKGEWQETEDTSLLVGGPVSRRANIQVRLIGADLSEVEIDAVMVKVESEGTFTHGPDTQSLLFEPGQSAADVKLLLAPGAPLRYRYQTTAFKSSGEISESPWKESTSSLLVISSRTL